MITDTKIVRSTSLNPWWNLAIEEYLLDRVEKEQAILYPPKLPRESGTSKALRKPAA